MQSDSTDRNTVVCKYLNYQYSRQGTLYTIRLPLLHIRLKSSTVEFETVGLVDSGATHTLLPREVAEALELQYEERGIEVEGAGAVFRTLATRLKRLQLLKNVTPFDTYTGIRVLVPAEVAMLPYPVLGRDYVFSRFDITFHENRRKLTFRKI